MRFIAVIIFVGLINASWAQVDFKEDSSQQEKNYPIIQQPNFDSTDFVLRYWVEPGNIPGTFAELCLSKKQKWSYRTGYIDNQKLVISDAGVRQIDLDSVWSALDEIGILSIKSQTETIWRGTNDAGETFIIRSTPDIYLISSGNYYIIELIKLDKIKRLVYADPARFVKMFAQHRAVSTDHERFLQVSRLLFNKFELAEIMRQRITERKATSKETKKKKRGGS